MTRKNFYLKTQCYFGADFVKICFSVSVLFASVLLSTLYSSKISLYTQRGLLICFNVIIPAIFPYMILSDLMLANMHFEKIPILKNAFWRLFKINSYALGAFIAGLICGFPTGVKLAKELYLSGKISKNEFERLIGFSNNPSPAFTVGGIGYALRGKISDGILLMLANILASILVGFLFSIGKKEANNIVENSDFYSFSLVKSVKEASLNTLVSCGFITLFSVLLGIISDFIPCGFLLTLIASFLELGNAAKIISASKFPYLFKITFSAFALSFSGISVHLQSKSIISDLNISMKKYIIMKLLCGIFSAFTVLATLSLISFFRNP